MSATNWEEVYRVQTARIAELEATIDAVMAANERATKRWQAAHPGKELVIPDQAKMVEWLLDELAKFDDPHRLHAHCVRHLTDLQVSHLFGERMTAVANDRDKLEAENAELLKDKERLDWIDVDPIDHISKIEFYWCNHSSISKIRANIDAARGEAKP